MPVSSKKSNKKNSSASKKPKKSKKTDSSAKKKKAPKKKMPKKVRDEIKRAASTVEDLVKQQMNENYTQDTRKTSADMNPFEDHFVEGEQAHALRSKKRMVYLAVISMSVAIVVLWMVNMRTLIYDIGKSNSTEAALINLAQDDLSEILQELETRNAQREQTQTNTALIPSTTATTTSTTSSTNLDRLIQAIQTSSSSTSTAATSSL